MNRIRTRVSVGVVAFAAATGVAFTGGPASATGECTRAELWYEVAGDREQVLPAGSCVVPTDGWQEDCAGGGHGKSEMGFGAGADLQVSCPL